MADPIIAKHAEAARAVREGLAAVGVEDDEALLIDTIEGETDLLEILDALVAQEDEDLILLEGVKARLADMSERKRRFEKRMASRRAVIDQALAIAELKKVERPTYTLTLANRKPSLVISEEADIPTRFWKPEPKLDRRALQAALEDGEPVPGACLSNAAPSATIRRK